MEYTAWTKSRLIGLGLMLSVVTAHLGCPSPAVHSTWTWQQTGDVLEIAYGNSAEGWPQMAALHVNTSALRIIYGPDSGWGPTVYLAPSLWTLEPAKTGGKETTEEYYLGAPVTIAVAEDGDDLVVTANGTIAGLAFTSIVRFSPPGDDVFGAQVDVATTGTVALANRPSEAFQPVHTATMHISETQWDTSAVEAGSVEHALPAEGWVIDPPGVTGDAFTLIGGSSVWKPNAPTIAVELDRDTILQGWVTGSADPNDDNVGFWAATDEVLSSWQYTIRATP